MSRRTKTVRYTAGEIGRVRLIEDFLPARTDLVPRGRYIKVRKRKVRVEEGSGNVFADLGLPNPEHKLLKAELTLQIYKIVKARGLTQTQAGQLLGIKQPHVSTLMRNRAGNFSIGRLIEFLTALGHDVEITVKPTRKAQGEMSVVMR
jgi:predicted XRE-type DNA-binding protein